MAKKPDQRTVEAATGAKGALSTEDRILRAARIEFIERGRDGARMERIARSAGVNKALIHYYFRSKAKLYRAVLTGIVRTVWGSLRDELATLNTESGFRGFLQTFVSTFIRALRANPDFPPVILRELAGGAVEFRQVAAELFAEFDEIPARFERVVAREAKLGRLRPMNPVQVIMNVMGMCTATFFLQPVVTMMYQRVFNKDFVPDDRFFHERISAITDMVCDGIVLKEDSR